MVYRGNLEEAERLSRQALEILTRALGEDHPDVAAARNNLAGVLERRGKLDEAETLFRKSAEGYVKFLGPDIRCSKRPAQPRNHPFPGAAIMPQRNSSTDRCSSHCAAALGRCTQQVAHVFMGARARSRTQGGTASRPNRYFRQAVAVQ